MDEPAKLHHLMRVRIHKALFCRLQDIATQETHLHGEYTSVSDLVRAALRNWIQTYEAAQKLETVHNPKSFQAKEPSVLELC